MMRLNWKLLATVFSPLVIATAAWGWTELKYVDTTFIPPDHAAIQYNDRPLNDTITILTRKLESGAAKLEPMADAPGYLPSILKNLDINPDSQVMVFSKTSFQSSLISPKNPRAIYFNDDTYVGYVRG